MTLPVDLSPFGTRGPGLFVAAVLALTRNLPANWLGLRVSTPFRRVAIDWLGGQPVDVVAWGARMRLYPGDNSCEKNALFTPQMFDVLERDVLAAAIDERAALGRSFTFVDVGANVGLYSLFVASRGGTGTHVVAAEPQPGIVERLSFNLDCNPGFNITVFPVAVTDHDGDAELVIRDSDRGGSYINKNSGEIAGMGSVRVPGRTLMAILSEADVMSIDALKIDIEGAEDLALGQFLRDAWRGLLPHLLLIEDRPDWGIDLYALLNERGYVRSARSRHNIIFRLP